MMRKVSLGVLLSLSITGCMTAPPPPPPAPPKPAPAPAVLFGTPTYRSQTPALEAIKHAPINQQVLLRFIVKADGSIRGVHAIFTNLSPADTTDVVKAVKDWRFKPAVDGERPVDRVFIYPLFFGPDARQQRTRFMCRNERDIYKPDSRCEIVRFGTWQIFRMNPVYPPDLLSKHLAGSVTLSFNIGARGQPIKPKVVAADPPGLFNAAALAAVQQWYFQPLTGKNGKGPLQHVTVTVKFTPPPAPHVVPKLLAPPKTH